MYNNLTILIVDDSAMERHLIKEIISKLNFGRIIEANSGEESVKLALEYQPNIILMDVIMPGMNGFQATKQIINNEGLKSVPIIMCTAKNQDTDKSWGARQGAKAYVTKPLDKNDLLEKINQLLG